MKVICIFFFVILQNLTINNNEIDICPKMKFLIEDQKRNFRQSKGNLIEGDQNDDAIYNSLVTIFKQDTAHVILSGAKAQYIEILPGSIKKDRMVRYVRQCLINADKNWFAKSIMDADERRSEQFYCSSQNIALVHIASL